MNENALLEAESFLIFKHFLHFSNFVNYFSKQTTDSQMHVGFSNMWSNMHIFLTEHPVATISAFGTKEIFPLAVLC